MSWPDIMSDQLFKVIMHTAGVRPIGIGEVVSRIIGKAIMKTTKHFLWNAVACIQLCAGHDAGCEAAVHAMAQIFDDKETEAMIFVDASNAFNRLKRQVALRNTRTARRARRGLT